MKNDSFMSRSEASIKDDRSHHHNCADTRCTHDNIQKQNLLSYFKDDPLQTGTIRAPRINRHQSVSLFPAAGLPAVKLHMDKLKAHHIEFREGPAKIRSLRSHSWHAQNFKSKMVRCCLHYNRSNSISCNSEKLTPAVGPEVINMRTPSNYARNSS